MIELIIPGRPIAKARPRFARRGKFVETYNDQETEEGRFLWEVKQQIKQPPIEGPISIQLYFYMPIPKSTSKKKIKLMLDGKIFHTKRPDFDNLIKFCVDCLNGMAWNDDSQIITAVVCKKYSNNPRTEIIIHECERI